MNYWEECISEAFDEFGVNATEQQIKDVAECVEGAYENYGMYSGNDVASLNYKSDAEIELEKIKKDLEDNRIYLATTEPCSTCNTKGFVKDGWGRSVTCMNCDGKGRV